MELGSEPMELGSKPMELDFEPMELGSEPFELLRLGSEVCRQFILELLTITTALTTMLTCT
jgi:hypothetical protein